MLFKSVVSTQTNIRVKTFLLSFIPTYSITYWTSTSRYPIEHIKNTEGCQKNKIKLTIKRKQKKNMTTTEGNTGIHHYSVFFILVDKTTV